MAAGVPRTGEPGAGVVDEASVADVDKSLVSIRDLAGRPRGTGFLADDHGTLVTSHEAVDGLARLVLSAPGERTCLVGADAVTVLPGSDLALVRTEGLGVPPLPVAAHTAFGTGTAVRLWAHGWRDARVVGPVCVTYTATDRFHLIDGVLELSLGGGDQGEQGAGAAEGLRLGGPAAGAPVLDPETGAVVAVLGTALHSGRRAGGFAVPLRAVAATDPDGPLAALLARNAATVPAYGQDLNLAGALQLTATSVGPPAWEGRAEREEPVERAETHGEFTRFAEDGRALVLGLVGDPGTGRSTELAALAARRARGPEPSPTVWLRGADLRADDGGVRCAVARALRAAGRVVAAQPDGRGGARTVGDTSAATPETVAGLARDAGRPLLVLLDGPEEMPPVLAAHLPAWVAGSCDWLREAGARLVVACRPEHWERIGGLFPDGTLYRPHRAVTAPPGAPARALPDCVRLGDLTPRQAECARDRYGLPAGSLAPDDARHPLALALLAEVRAALPERTVPPAADAGADSAAGGGTETAAPPERWEIFAAHLDLVCLRIAVRLAAAEVPPPRGGAVGRLAARVAGRVHDVARRCLGPGQGELDRESFEELFPWATGWASAVLGEGLLVPAGAGYRFVHEEFADWLQGLHLDLDAALRSLVHQRRHLSVIGGGASAAHHEPDGDDTEERTERLSWLLRGWLGMGGGAATGTGPSADAEFCDTPSGDGGAAGDDPVGAAEEEPRTLPVPRHRIGPVIQALLLLGRRAGPQALARRLEDLVAAVDRSAEDPEPGTGPFQDTDKVADQGGAPADAVWWAAHLLGETLLRVPDATPYRRVLELLAERITDRAVGRGGFRTEPHRGRLGGLAEFGPWFWLRLPLGTGDRLDLLRLLVPADGPPRPPGEPGEEARRFLPAAGELLSDDPCAVQPLLCRWFDDERPLPGAAESGSADAALRPTVAAAAQALLHTHRRRAVDDLTEALVASAHPRADELLAALAEDEPSAVCRAVDRWAHDERAERHVAAASYGLLAAPWVDTGADRELLRYAALALLARPDDCALHGAALALLVRDPATRSRYLPQALSRFAAGDAHLPPSALAVALATHPEPVLAAFRARLYEPGEGAGEVLRTLAAVTTPALARRAAGLVRELIEHRPERARHAAEFVDRRLEQGPAARAVLFPLVADMLRGQPAQVRRAFVPVLAAPGTRVSGPLRQELLEVLLERERYGTREQASAGTGCGGDCGNAAVLDALLRAAAEGASRRGGARSRELVHRTGTLLVRTPEGAACFDRRLVQLAREVPGFAVLVRGWLASAPEEWAALVGPGARRQCEVLAEAADRATAPPERGTTPPPTHPTGSRAWSARTSTVMVSPAR